MKRNFILILGICSFLCLPVLALAKTGVGVRAGEIRIDQPLKPGLIYTLSSFSVVNTGNEPGEYEVSVEYHQDQEQRPDMGLRPDKEWFKFEPERFYLEPGEVQPVQVKLSLPVKGVKPGKYFVYLEGHPVKKDTSGRTSIGVAAATKLYFTIAPANALQGIYYRFISLCSRYHPWDTIILTLIFVALVLRFISRHFKFQIVKK